MHGVTEKENGPEKHRVVEKENGQRVISARYRHRWVQLQGATSMQHDTRCHCNEVRYAGSAGHTVTRKHHARKDQLLAAVRPVSPRTHRQVERYANV